MEDNNSIFSNKEVMNSRVFVQNLEVIVEEGGHWGRTAAK
jgi:hypothetical protein